MKYYSVYRNVFRSTMIVRQKEEGADLEILESCEEFYDDAYDEDETFMVDGDECFWNEWADADTWKKVWLSGDVEDADINEIKYSDIEEILEDT